jgi:hypothetical protein
MRKLRNLIMLPLLIIFVGSWLSITNAQPLSIENKAMMGFCDDVLMDKAIDSLIVRMADSIKYAETSERFERFPRVSANWRFSEMPCVELVYLRFNLLPITPAPDRDPYMLILFNKCDSSFYHFGGGLESFTNVVKQYLANNSNPHELLRLLEFYLNTQSESNEVYIIDSVADFESICKQNVIYEGEWKNSFYDIGKLEKDKKLVKNVVKPAKIKKTKDGYRIEFYVYNYSDRKIEYFKFLVKRSKIEIQKRKTYFGNIGPGPLSQL